jgi:hypothetical protein
MRTVELYDAATHTMRRPGDVVSYPRLPNFTLSSANYLKKLLRFRNAIRLRAVALNLIVL